MSRTRWSLAAAIALSTVIGLTACGGDDDSTITTGAVTLESAGASTGRVQLPGLAKPGTGGSAVAEMAISVAVHGSGADTEVPITVRMSYDGKVTAADAAGFTLQTTFTKAEVVDAPSGVDESKVAALEGVSYTQHVAADGALSDPKLVDDAALTSSQRDAFDQFGSKIDTASFGYPDQPVGVGATWSTVTKLDSQGIKIEVPYHFELTKLEGKHYEIKVDYSKDIDTTMEGTPVTGTLHGGGTSSGTVGEPLSATTALKQDFDVKIEDNGSTASMKMTVDMSIAPS